MTSVVCPLTNRLRPRVVQPFFHVTHRFAHPVLAQGLKNRRHAHRRDQADDGHDDHHFNQREGAPRRFLADDRRFHREAQAWICEINWNSGRKMLNSRKATMTAITMISAGSMRLVITRNAICSSPS